ncbi:hypothetical protein [Faecalispora jeddahensis]|uniref:hypothetical protein n=1 Tax=Faecalispora jeddahensis TaxID=1414721 RepID=UPI00189A2A33|nr:hypothetical protein [Faecalispora jeddahensis]
MASFGAQNPRFAPIVTEPAGALPTYGEIVTVGRLIKADRSIQYASGKLYADNELAESVDEFVSGSIAMETDDLEDEVAVAIYGAEVASKEVHYKSGQTAPIGGLTYRKALMRNGIKFFKTYYYPRVKAVMGNDTAQAKSDSITFGTESTTFTVFRCKSDDWCITEVFPADGEAAAIAWCDSKLGKTEP